MSSNISTLPDKSSSNSRSVHSGGLNPTPSVPPKRTGKEQKFLKRHIAELIWTEKLIKNFADLVDAKIEHCVNWKSHEFPIYSLSLGTRESSAPAVLFTGGIHGLERISSQVLLAWLQSFLERARWDKSSQVLLQNLHIIIMPIVNPVGMCRNTRSNGNGVDLNRNAPVQAEIPVPFIGGGHRISSRLPCFRGYKEGVMEEENQALENLVRREVFRHPIGLALDLHSGLGMRDHIWFPYAYRKRPIGTVANYLALKFLLERTYPHQTYVFEPQSIHYGAHGDVWDYFCKQAKEDGRCMLLPLTLEMGSWNWIKKNPLQLTQLLGIFNPLIAHRHARVLRRHILLMDFILSAALSYEAWLPDENQSRLLKQAAQQMWYT